MAFEMSTVAFHNQIKWHILAFLDPKNILGYTSFTFIGIFGYDSDFYLGILRITMDFTAGLV